ncbi:YdcF family protein [Hydrogenimonas urashimensis]|uniref:YdcF family protein n=1 Tax=Hydrogenimonas urashimensis TaxID=2740515 RepID=UPI0019167696|nr:YdcF family protein [Hydrogenimonas urashimensis]
MIYTLSKLFGALFLPPGVFILVLVLAALLARRWRPFFATSAALFYLLSLEPVGHALLEPLEAPYRKVQLPADADAVVMLGGGKIEESPNFPLKTLAFKRAVYALIVAKKLDLPLIVSGGGLHGYTEGDAFLDTLKDLGPILATQPPRIEAYEKRFAILPEKRSLDTYQNVLYTRQLLPPSPKVVVVTSASHMRRALMIFAHFGIDAVPAATDFHVSKEPWDGYDLLPQIDALYNSCRALHEYFGIVKISLRDAAETK